MAFANDEFVHLDWGFFFFSERLAPSCGRSLEQNMNLKIASIA